MFARVIIGFAICFFTAIFSGCGGQLYKVTPLPAGAPPEASVNAAAGDSPVISVVALDGDQSLERFEANLPLAGVIALDVSIVNKTPAAINPAALKLELRDASGKAFKMLTPKNALKRVMKFYGNAFYRIDARARTIEAYEATALPLEPSIEPQQERRGLLFFEAPRNAARLGGLTLQAAGAKPPINFKVN